MPLQLAFDEAFNPPEEMRGTGYLVWEAPDTPLKSPTMEDHISPLARLERLPEDLGLLLGPHRVSPRLQQFFGVLPLCHIRPLKITVLPRLAGHFLDDGHLLHLRHAGAIPHGVHARGIVRQLP